MSKRIKKEAIARIRLNRELMAKLGQTTKTHGRSAILSTNRLLKQNKNDGPLTTFTRLRLISKYLNQPIKDLIENVRPETDESGEREHQASCSG